MQQLQSSFHPGTQVLRPGKEADLADARATIPQPDDGGAAKMTMNQAHWNFVTCMLSFTVHYVF